MKQPMRYVAALATLILAATACRPKATPSPDAMSAVASPSATETVSPLSAGARIEDERNTISVVRSVAQSTVFVTQHRASMDWFTGEVSEVPAGSGSGFAWDANGHIVTNFHVVRGANALTVTFNDQRTLEATLVGVDPRKDIAVIRVNAGAKPLVPVKVAMHARLEVGQKTIAIGNPFGLDHTVTTGIVSALGRQVPGPSGLTIRDMIQTDAAINPGNSGGPLLDSAGELIGMNTAIYSKSGSSAGIGFAVPVSTILRVVPQIIRTGHVERTTLPMRLDTEGRVSRALGLSGVAVISVPEGSPGARAGVRGLSRTAQGIALGDVIVAVDGKKVASFDDLYNVLDEHKAGEAVSVTLQRGRETATVTLPTVAEEE